MLLVYFVISEKHPEAISLNYIKLFNLIMHKIKEKHLETFTNFEPIYPLGYIQFSILLPHLLDR